MDVVWNDLVPTQTPYKSIHKHSSLLSKHSWNGIDRCFKLLGGPKDDSEKKLPNLWLRQDHFLSINLFCTLEFSALKRLLYSQCKCYLEKNKDSWHEIVHVPVSFTYSF